MCVPCMSNSPGAVHNSSVDFLLSYPQGAQTVKNPAAMQESWVKSLGQEDPLEKGMATHCSILPWRTSWTEEPGGLQSMKSQKVRHDRATDTLTFKPCWGTIELDPDLAHKPR